jgi:hypothetical protein
MYTALYREYKAQHGKSLQVKFLTTIQDNTSELAQGKPTTEIASCSNCRFVEPYKLRGTIHSQLEFNFTISNIRYSLKTYIVHYSLTQYVNKNKDSDDCYYSSILACSSSQ